MVCSGPQRRRRHLLAGLGVTDSSGAGTKRAGTQGPECYITQNCCAERYHREMVRAAAAGGQVAAWRGEGRLGGGVRPPPCALMLLGWGVFVCVCVVVLCVACVCVCGSTWENAQLRLFLAMSPSYVCLPLSAWVTTRTIIPTAMRYSSNTPMTSAMTPSMAATTPWVLCVCKHV